MGKKKWKKYKNMQCIVWDLIIGIWTESTGLIPIWWPIHQVAFVYFDTKPSPVKPSQKFGRCPSPPPPLNSTCMNME